MSTKKETSVKFYLTEKEYRTLKNKLDFSKYNCIKGQPNHKFNNMWAFFEKKTTEKVA